MKQIITFLFICLMGMIAQAKELADIMVSYDYTFPTLKTGKIDSQNQYVLLANTTASKFYSPQTQYQDSVSTTPQGKTAMKEINAAVLRGDYGKIPQKDGSFYVTIAKGIMRTYDSAGAQKYVVEERLPDIKWEICDSVKTILGYECTKAVAEFHGRKWTVWFTPDIPLQIGPWKLFGLPGLILEAEGDNQYRFVATGLQPSHQQITKVPLSNEYEKTSRLDFLRTKRTFVDNPLAPVLAQFGGADVTITDENGNDLSSTHHFFMPREEVDFIETDY